MVAAEIEKVQFKGHFSDPPDAEAVGTRREGSAEQLRPRTTT